MKKIAIIPARYASSRLHGKSLIDINGKPMIQHVYEQTIKADLDDVIIACDDNRILEAVKAFNGKAIMTRSDHMNGTSRIAEVAEKIDTDVIINVQGDEPLINPQAINQLVGAFEDEKCVCATLKSLIIDCNEINDPNTVKVITDIDSNAIYFSRLPIPYYRNKIQNSNYFKHIGIYGYKKEFLLKYINLPPSDLEIAEALEQLRVIDNGYSIKTLETMYEFIGVDTKKDLEKVRRLIKDKSS